jgi:hypothetical protein
MKCPKQIAFSNALDELLSSYYDSMRDRFSVDEQDDFIDKFVQQKKTFINNWCPTLKTYEEL